MASINDLATAATIASSAVALQSSPTQQPAQPAQSSPPPPQPLTPSAPFASLATPAPPATASTPTTSVLAAPQISPQDAAQAQIPVPPVPVPLPPAPTEHVAEPAATVAVDGAMDVDESPAPPPPVEKVKPVRGTFIAFEGMDRAGKTTQAKLLQQRFIEDGREVRFMRFPDRTTPIGQMIDAYLQGQAEIEDHVIHLLFTANRWEALKVIQQSLAAGVTIIADRYYHSGIVYSAAKQNPSLSLSWAKAPEVGLPRPDIVLFLDLEEEIARKRGGWGGEIYEKGEMQRRVRELFWGLSMGDLGKGTNGVGLGNVAEGASNGRAKGEFRQEEEDLQIVDANLGVEELAEKVWETVLPRLEAVERGEVGHTVRTVR